VGLLVRATEQVLFYVMYKDTLEVERSLTGAEFKIARDIINATVDPKYFGGIIMVPWAVTLAERIAGIRQA